ncbi:MAG: hypothetical protein KF861_19840 [Planctomycetaceae bacterium]|nr:hypothetical protein [Planctomycetaceae bacterium]
MLELAVSLQSSQLISATACVFPARRMAAIMEHRQLVSSFAPGDLVAGLAAGHAVL